MVGRFSFVEGRMWTPAKKLRLLWVLPTFVLVSYTFYNGEKVGEPPRSHMGRAHLGLKEDRIILRSLLQANSVDCIPPAIEDFPGDFFTQEQRQKGGVIAHFLITAYLCGVLAIVCDEYFVPSLELISEVLKIPTDVAGATIMAIGTSSPELYSAVIGSFITEGDIGVGTIVGSAVFNILGVTSVTGIYLMKTTIQLDWYPILRDSLVYIVAVSALAYIISDGVVYWYEATALLVMFVLYIVIMYFNSHIERTTVSQVNKFCVKWRSDGHHASIESPGQERPKEDTPLLSRKILPDGTPTTNGHNETATNTSPPMVTVVLPCEQKDIIVKEIPPKEMPSDATAVEIYSPWSMTEEGGFLSKACWILMWPASLCLYLSIPNCKRFPRAFPLTFFMSVIWIGILSYVSAWMVTIIGYTLEIPDSVAGLTFLAAGISVPEIISSVLIVRLGLGNMAICNLIGSNIFDILFCLGFPWLIKTLAFSSAGSLDINSGALTYTTLTLLSTVVLMVLTLSLVGWKLNLRVGLICLVLYIGFIILACLYETNVFGYFNPMTCVR